MKDNDLLIILVVILILVVCYYIYKQCKTKTIETNNKISKGNLSLKKSNFQDTLITKEDNLSIIKFLQKTQLPFIMKNNYTSDGYIYSITDNEFKNLNETDNNSNRFRFVFDDTQENYEIEKYDTSDTSDTTQSEDNTFYYYDLEYYLPDDYNKAIVGYTKFGDQLKKNYLNLDEKYYYGRIFFGSSDTPTSSTISDYENFLKNNLEQDVKNKIKSVSIKIPQQSNNMHITQRLIYISNKDKKNISTRDSYQTMSQTQNFGGNNFDLLHSKFNGLYHNYYFDQLITKNKDNIKNNHKLRFALDEKGLYLVSHNNNKPYGVFYNNTPLWQDEGYSTDYLETISFKSQQLNFSTWITPFTDTVQDIVPGIISLGSSLDTTEFNVGDPISDENQSRDIKYKLENDKDDIIIKQKGGLIRDNNTLQFTKKTQVADPIANNEFQFFDDTIGKINGIYPRYRLHTLFVPIGKEVEFKNQTDDETYLSNEYIALNAVLMSRSDNTIGKLGTKKRKIFTTNDVGYKQFQLMNVENSIDGHRSNIKNLPISADYSKLSPISTSSLYIDRVYCPDEEFPDVEFNERKYITKSEYNIFTNTDTGTTKRLWKYGEKSTDRIQENQNNVIAHKTCKLFNYNNRFNLLDANNNENKKKYLIINNIDDNLGIHNQDEFINDIVSDTSQLNTPYFIPSFNVSDGIEGVLPIENYMVSKSNKSLITTLNKVNETTSDDDKLIYVNTNPINFIKSYYNDMKNNHIELSANLTDIFLIKKISDTTTTTTTTTTPPSGVTIDNDEYYLVKKEGNIFYFLYESSNGLEFLKKFDDSDTEHDKYLFKVFNNNVQPTNIKLTIEDYFIENCTLTIEGQRLSVKKFFNLLENKSRSNLKQLLINYIFDTSISNNDRIPDDIFEDIPENPNKWFAIDYDLRIRLNDLRVLVYNTESKLFEFIDETQLSIDDMSKYKAVFVLNDTTTTTTTSPKKILYIGYTLKSLSNVYFNIEDLSVTGTRLFNISSDDTSFFYKLVDITNNKICHLVYKVIGGIGSFKIEYLETSHFYSVYENGILVKSYSPYINATNNQFIITNPKINLNIEPYSKQTSLEYPNELITEYHYGTDSDKNIYTTDEVKPIFIINILNTPLKGEINVIKDTGCSDTTFKIINKIADIQLDGNSVSGETYKKNHRVEIKTENILNDYIDIQKNSDVLFSEIKSSNEKILENIDNLNTQLTTQIENVKTYNNNLTNDNNTKLSEINKQGQYFRNVINTDIKNKLKKISTLQFNIQTTDKKVRDLKIKYQLKVKYSFGVTQDEEYLNRLIQTIDKTKFSITLLENQLNDRKSEIYKNYVKTNGIINQINNFIYTINKTLNNKKELRENFEDINVSNFNDNLYNKNNELLSNLENILEYSNTYKTKLDERNNLIIEKDKLVIINNFYNKLINSFTSSDESSIKMSFTNLINNLNNIENNLSTNLNKSRTELIDWEEKYATAEFIPIELKTNPELVNQLELEMLDLEDTKERLNKKIININQSDRAQSMLNTLKKINIDINKPQLRDFNPMEGFQNPVFRSAESHNNYFLSFKPMNNNQYKIRVNDKCLNVYGTNNYRLDNCNLSSTSQLFKTQRINTEIDALNINKDQVFDGSNNIKYPYHQIKSTISNDCVNIDRDGISLSTCSSNSLKQRWNLSTEEKICLDN